MLVDSHNLWPSVVKLYHVTRFLSCAFFFLSDLASMLAPCRLLGVTWLVSPLAPLQNAFVYIFTILNSAQVSF